MQRRPTVYLCGGINARLDAECRDWRESAKGGLLAHIRDPMDRDYRGRELEPGIADEIVTNDKQDIDECDALLVYYDKPSVGTSMEILYAWERKRPIVLVDVSDKPLSPWLIYHVTVIKGSLAEAIAWLNAQAS